MAEQCGFNGGSNDVTSMVQVNVGQSRVKSDLLSTAVLADLGRSMEASGGIISMVKNHSKKQYLHELPSFVIFS